MKQEAAFFDGKEPVLIYIAKRLKDALKLEGLLTEAGLDYGVEADEYRGGYKPYIGAAATKPPS